MKCNSVIVLALRSMAVLSPLYTLSQLKYQGYFMIIMIKTEIKHVIHLLCLKCMHINEFNTVPIRTNQIPEQNQLNPRFILLGFTLDLLLENLHSLNRFSLGPSGIYFGFTQGLFLGSTICTEV